MIRLTSVAAVCALAFSSTSALAAAQSSVILSNVSFTLIDLNPLDGIAPSFSFLSSAGNTLLNVSATEDGLGTDSSSRQRVGTFSFSRDFLTDLVAASAAGGINGYNLSVSGAATAAGTSYSANAATGAGATLPATSLPLNISLSANSLLLVQADASLFASTTYGDSASAQANLSLSYSYGSGASAVSVQDNKSLSLQFSGANAGTESLHDFLSSVFLNTSGQTQKASFGLSASVAGQAVTPVPEPETYALVLAGVGVAGLLARRRRG